MRLVIAAFVLAVGVATALPLAASPAPGEPFLVGVDDNTIEWLGRPDGVLAVDRDLGIGAIRLTLAWHPQQVQPTQVQKIELHRIAGAVAGGMRVVLGVYGRATDAPRDEQGQTAYCTFLRNVVARIPRIHDVVVWNEVNSPHFWRPRLDAPAAYESLLARCWDTLHALSPEINVIASTAPRYQPATFIGELGAAYRASGRSQPIFDTFGHNPYPQYSTESPGARHDDGFIGEGDYDTLTAALDIAFRGTAQPVPGSAGVRIWYLEDGFETAITPAKRRLYHGTETARYLAAPAPVESGAAVGLPNQGAQLRAALELAYCQPAVAAFFNFELIDEHRLDGWQSGLLWTDGTRKPAYDDMKAAIADVAAGAIDCGG